QVERALLLDVVVGKRATVLQLLAGEDKTLLVRGNAWRRKGHTNTEVKHDIPFKQPVQCIWEGLRLTLLVLNLSLHVLNGVRRLHLQRDRLARQSLHKNLHATTQTQHQVQRALLLDVVVGKRATVLQLLAGEDKTLLVRGNAWRRKGHTNTEVKHDIPFKQPVQCIWEGLRLTLLVLNLSLHVLNGVRRLHLQRDRLARQSLHKNLHATTQTQHQVERALLLDVVVGKRATVLQLLAGEDKTLLVR
ncbi:hypothetical protein Vafri_22020, partial [Volvox africanus]